MEAQDHRHYAEHIRSMLTEQLQTLKLLERVLKRQPVQDIRERLRLEDVSTAIELLQQCLDKLTLALDE